MLLTVRGVPWAPSGGYAVNLDQLSHDPAAPPPIPRRVYVRKNVELARWGPYVVRCASHPRQG